MDADATHLLVNGEGRRTASPGAFLETLRAEHSLDELVQRLASLRDLKVLIVGDTIIDEYHFCRPYGMASKSSSIAAQYLREEAHVGGVLAVANHIAALCDQVTVVSCLGAQESREAFIRERLKPNVEAKLFTREDAPTVIKRRFVQPVIVGKLFEVAFFNDRPLPASVEDELNEHLAEESSEFDVVVVTDFGHGLLSARTIDTLCRHARFLAVNAQLNSINHGYNLVTKFPRADFVSIDEEEARMAARARYGDLEKLIKHLAEELHAQLFAVTRGFHGSVTYREGDGFARTPVLSREVVDTIGAGDAFLSVTSLCARAAFPPNLIGLFGGIAGALAVRSVGNRESITLDAIQTFLREIYS